MVKSYIHFSEKQCKLLGTGPLEKGSNFGEGCPHFTIKKKRKKCHSHVSLSPRLSASIQRILVEVIYSLNEKHCQVSFNFEQNLEQKWIQWLITLRDHTIWSVYTTIRYRYFCYQEQSQWVWMNLTDCFLTPSSYQLCNHCTVSSSAPTPE